MNLSSWTEGGWIGIAVVLLLALLAAWRFQARNQRKADDEAPPLPEIEPPPAPAPHWLSREALEAIKATPVGPKTPDETRAYRLARLLIGELNDFCEAQVDLGLLHNALYSRLREDLDRSRETYLERTAGVEKDFLQQEVLHCVAKGYPEAFG